MILIMCVFILEGRQLRLLKTKAVAKALGFFFFPHKGPNVT